MASPQQQEAQGVAVTGVPKLPLGLQRVQAMRGAQLCPSLGVAFLTEKRPLACLRPCQ